MVFACKILPEANKSSMNRSLNIDDVIIPAEKSWKSVIGSKFGLLCRLFTSGFGRPDTADVNVNRRRPVTAVVTVNRKRPDTAVMTIMTLRLFKNFLKIRFSAQKSGSRPRCQTMLKIFWNTQKTPTKHVLRLFKIFFWKSRSRLKNPVLGPDVEQC